MGRRGNAAIVLAKELYHTVTENEKSTWHGFEILPGDKADDETTHFNLTTNHKGTIMHDETETIRKQRIAEINANPGSRETLREDHGEVWTTNQLRENFDILGFLAPYVVVRRRSDGAKGSVEFQHNPRMYFNFQPDNFQPK